ncbi:MAG: VOC family protein [Candidatus Caenarcaniphilales bacterium]|nr:VOC family protein [Candidatus Caenarcaniphilales bacterium]
MKQLNVYLMFEGNCQEALEFYKTCLKGEVVSKQTVGESPMESPEEYKNRIIHAEFKAEGIYFMAADAFPGQKVASANNVNLSINLDDPKEQEEIFGKLSEGGTIGMPLQDTFWGARFGMIVDKYGIHWMLNCQK